MSAAGYNFISDEKLGNADKIKPDRRSDDDNRLRVELTLYHECRSSCTSDSIIEVSVFQWNCSLYLLCRYCE